MEKVKELRVKVKPFLTKRNPKYPDKIPVPMRTMFGYSTRETANGIHMVLKGKPEPSSHCLHCGRVIKHPVSLLYGIGPICGGHYHVNPLESEEELNLRMEEIKQKLANVVWEGWLPKNYIEWEETGGECDPKNEEKAH
ncbi:hypothetical protein IMZ31_24330 (plasmid) [Pontibacillus sp. ALD_SL1]|uniref:DUF6011 domain-containing protein n=1 Tax=Pontibacillus sp. ALD_SL1 TaxID=2777185 RepID=UPI001A977234|nr:DUF6011 domain-containing protein [Pontibacillus sp. ALD_SL1]QST02581.1 hypothetical protein IMZ31_24330 [Pontibacillus sp. ALD_SL1]